jgi:hypothetical protein
LWCLAEGRLDYFYFYLSLTFRLVRCFYSRLRSEVITRSTYPNRAYPTLLPIYRHRGSVYGTSLSS